MRKGEYNEVVRGSVLHISELKVDFFRTSPGNGDDRDLLLGDWTINFEIQI